nr:hypothetical protein CFP56_13100 [Quercus suber]
MDGAYQPIPDLQASLWTAQVDNLFVASETFQARFRISQCACEICSWKAALVAAQTHAQFGHEFTASGLFSSVAVEFRLLVIASR